MAELPEPHFIDRDPAAILREIVARYEELAERPLGPAQAERFLADVMAYRETLLRIDIQETAKQNLVRFARYPMIDLLAEILGPQAGRLAARGARTPLRFELQAAQLVDVPVPKGTRVRTTDDKVTFATDIDATIAAGLTIVEVPATATEPGPHGNGYAPGQVSKLVDELAAPATVTNTAATADGAAQEDTERMRARLPEALALQAAAGPSEAYRAHALVAHPEVLDAIASSPEPMHARVAVLATYGTPTQEILDDVEEALSAERVRPMNDVVEVVAAPAVDYAIEAELTLYVGTDAGHEDRVLAAAERVAELYALERRSGLGRAPVASQLGARLSAVAGVYRVAVVAPADPAVGPDEWARCTAITITVAGYTTEKEPT